jgi:hypothetical protein
VGPASWPDLPVLAAPCANQISLEDTDSCRMSRCFRSAFSIFETAPLMATVLSAIVRKLNGPLYRFPLRRKESLQILTVAQDWFRAANSTAHRSGASTLAGLRVGSRRPHVGQVRGFSGVARFRRSKNLSRCVLLPPYTPASLSVVYSRIFRRASGGSCGDNKMRGRKA